MRKGFTLVELSIVMIVIGLLLGAILKGQEIIRTAKLKRIISDFQNISTAIYTYEDRYDELPGDDSTSVIAKKIPSQGNSDGLVSDIESTFVIRHLRKAGLISGEHSDNHIRHALGGPIKVIQGDLAKSLTNTSANMSNMPTTAVCFENIEVSDAQLLDDANDDGKYNSGALQSSASFETEGLVTVCAEI